jgi:hypothetical protein
VHPLLVQALAHGELDLGQYPQPRAQQADQPLVPLVGGQ